MAASDGDAPMTSTAPLTGAASPDGYTVLARRWRPQTFGALIGQDALVRTLSNAFERGRIPHAMILTGVRGVGKTTTARIVAKGLNCLNTDGPTTEPCGVCDSCVAIAESRHVDVLEMDAASRTGIDDIREIIESVRYRPVEARGKVYIIDEVHMLSKSAFNGLLKTLEEPPPHVTFILATTDIHKVPVTVLSRCMRFDLRRVETQVLADHLARLCAEEGVTAEPEALGLLARAAEGSVRDALSILDQALAHGSALGQDAGGGQAGGAVTAEAVRAMLGLADGGRIFALFELVMAGKPAEALAAARALYDDGADPLSILRELCDACHLTTVLKVDPARAEDPTLSPADREAGKRLSEALPMRGLNRAWQLLLKSLEETARAPSALSALEMAVIRLTHVSDLPSPEELVRRLGALDPGGGGGGQGVGGQGAGGGAQGSGGARGSGGDPSAGPGAPARAAVGAASMGAASMGAAPIGAASGGSLPSGAGGAMAAAPALRSIAGGAAAPEPQSAPQPASQPVPRPSPQSAPQSTARPAAAPEPASKPEADARPEARPEMRAAPAPAARAPGGAVETYGDILALVRARRDAKMLFELHRYVRPGPAKAGQFEFTPAEGAPAGLAAALNDRLNRWTGRRWVVSIAEGHETETMSEARARTARDLREQAEAHPLVQAVLATFPGAELKRVTSPDQQSPAAFGAPPPPDDDDDASFFEEGWAPDDPTLSGDWEPDDGL